MVSRIVSSLRLPFGRGAGVLLSKYSEIQEGNNMKEKLEALLKEGSAKIEGAQSEAELVLLKGL